MSVTCAKFGFENSEQARFCGGCGAPLEAEAAARETRKTYERKGAVIHAAKVREKLAGVHAA